MRFIVLGCAMTALAAASGGLPSALAAGGNAIINDCEANGQLTHNYTVPQWSMRCGDGRGGQAVHRLPDVIEHALIQRKSAGGSGVGKAPAGRSAIRR